MAVDNYWRLYYNPNWVKSLSVGDATGVLYHEVLHLVRLHSGRCLDIEANKDIWNIAADCEINDDLRDEAKVSGDFTLPDDGTFPDTYNLPLYKSAEEYYALLLDNGSNRFNRFSECKVMSGMCGSGAGGISQEFEDGEPSSENPGLTESEVKVSQLRVALDIQEHVKTIGDVPSHIKELVSLINDPPKVRWQSVLESIVRNIITYKVGSHDFSFRKRSSRSTGRIIFPAMIKPTIRIAGIIDTSGSMSSKELERVIVEINSILKKVSPQNLEILSVDTEVHFKKSVSSVKQIELTGRGGTDMVVGINAALKSSVKPDIIIVCTDGYTPWPDFKPRIPIIVCLTSNIDKTTVPSWAKVVNIT
jgi:predicted metal-dependent peptidase